MKRSHVTRVDFGLLRRCVSITRAFRVKGDTRYHRRSREYWGVRNIARIQAVLTGMGLLPQDATYTPYVADDSERITLFPRVNS